MTVNAEQVKSDLKNIYSRMEGMCFSGRFWGRGTMPTTENERDIILFTDVDDAKKGILTEICQTVLQKYERTVWKGITGPEDNPIKYNDYWLWVHCSSDLNPNESYTFQVKTIAPFSLVKPKAGFEYGININLDKQ